MRHPYSQALLASMPNLENTSKHELASIAGLPPDLSKEIVGCRFAPRCSYATDQCRVEEPPLTFQADHAFACFHPVDGPKAVTIRVNDRVAAARANPKELLRVEDLTKEFAIKAGLIRHKVGAIHAVSNVNFSINEGETFGLVGESGCGKTTIGRMVVGLETPTGGKVFFDDQLVSARNHKPSRAERRDRQMMFQDPYSSLDPRMKVGQILAEPLMIQHVGNHAAQAQRVSELLMSVGLEPVVADRYPHEFSGGQRQRIGLARALALNPRLIVADEPVSALDVSIQAQILNLMKDLQVVHNLSYVMVSHDLAVVYYMADTIGVMYLGKIVEIGDAESVFRTPAHPYTQGLLDAVPIPDPVLARAQRGHQVKGELPSPVNPPSGCRFRTRCPRVQDICANEEPPFTDFGADPSGGLPLPVAHAGVPGRGQCRGPGRRLVHCSSCCAAGDSRHGGLALDEANLEGVTQGVADVVDRHDHEDEHRRQREDLPPEAVLDLGGPRLEHGAPVGLGGLDAQAQEAQRREEEDGVGDRERGDGHDVADRVRKHVATDDVHLAAAHRRGGLGVLELSYEQRVTSDDAGVAPPQREPDDADEEHGRAPEDRDQGQQQEDVGDRQEGVEEAHH